MADKRTPPLLTRGRYQLKMPWQADPAKIYVCHAIRSFKDLYEREIDPFAEYYEPRGLDQNAFDEDVAAKANIITLIAEDESIIYVPDTYIVSYPDMGNYKYSHMVLSVSMGPLPDYLDLSYLKGQVSNLVSDVIGASPEVNEHRAASTGAVSPDQHETLEAARLASIELRETDYARLQDALITIDDQSQKIQTLEQILIDNGLLA